MRIGTISSEARARNVALFGFFLQLIFVGILLWFSSDLIVVDDIVSRSWNVSPSAVAAARYMIPGIGIWMILIILFEQRRKVAEEALESEALQRERAVSGSQTIFETEAEEFLVQKKRLIWILRWLMPMFVIYVILSLGLGSYVFLLDAGKPTLSNYDGLREITNPTLNFFFLLGVAFAAFLFSRYVLGMSRQPALRLLRAPATFLFGGALITLLTALSVGVINLNTRVVEVIMAYVTSIAMGILAVEFGINFILDFYRPRAAGEELRAPFESRLIGMISEPGEIAKSIADAMNYQFGFEVSSTWFYKMLEQMVLPLIVMSIGILFLMTSVVVVDADQLAVKERYGKPVSSEPMTPGLYFKMPWPIEQVYKENVFELKELVVGEVKLSDETEEDGHGEIVLWTEEHGFVPRVDVLVAVEQDAQDSVRAGGQAEGVEQKQSVPVSILRVSLVLHYQIQSDQAGFYNYLYRYQPPERLGDGSRSGSEQMLRNVAYRELLKQAVTWNYKEIMTKRREEVAGDLQAAIASKVNELELGIDVKYVGFLDVHPPTDGEVAQAYQEVIKATQEKQTLAKKAMIEKTKTLIEVAGSVIKAQTLHELVNEKNALGEDQQARRDELQQRIQDELIGNAEAGIDPIRGKAGHMIAKAKAISFRAISLAATKASTNDLDIAAYQASPRLFVMRKALQTISGELDDIRKYVVIADQEQNVIIELDHSEESGLQIINTKDK